MDDWEREILEFHFFKGGKTEKGGECKAHEKRWGEENYSIPFENCYDNLLLKAQMEQKLKKSDFIIFTQKLPFSP